MLRPTVSDVEDRVVDRGAAGAQREGAHAALERGDALLEHVGGRVHDARVDVARHREVEQVRAVLRAVELVGHRLVDRRRDRVRGRVTGVAGVDQNGFVTHLLAPGLVVELTRRPPS
jgi:hypothetical protein